MKNTIKLFLSAVCAVSLLSGCIKETVPNTSYVTADQVASSPSAFQSFVDALTSTVSGQFVYASGSTNAYDFGLPSFYLNWDLLGNDIVPPNMTNGWFDSFYTGTGLGPTTANAQKAWTCYYKWIKACNEVLALSGDNPTDAQKPGAGEAYFYRAYYYMELAQMFANATASVDPAAETVPYVSESTTVEELQHNPRLSNAEIFSRILSDLDKAEAYLSGVSRSNVYTPDVSCVYGMKARAYLLTGDWAKAKEYAKKAQAGYTLMSEAVYTDWDAGFNTPTAAWMLAVKYNTDDPNIQLNDADSSWGSWMIMEVNPKTSGCGYAANYGCPFMIDRHLYETIPATDFRRNCFVDFAIDEMDKADALVALKAYTKYPEWIYSANVENSAFESVGGLNFKFRPAQGDTGRDNQYIGFAVSVPVMRVEEMYLIEAEAAGRMNESEGIALLTAFAKTRDAAYVYGTHTDAYYNTSTSQFLNECWWQRRVEFWGEGLATKDVKRLQKGIIRSYPGTNHVETHRYNVEKTPDWMNLCIVQTETNYNFECTNNPEPIAPGGDSPEFAW